ncbi:hypothetical protein [Streptomyces sp. CA-106110]|uniref:hypothetical protein n=1 Tax=Streptomyces sp. CA-106110 TaxID=3240044 RepID=UPI003D8AB643
MARVGHGLGQPVGHGDHALAGLRPGVGPPAAKGRPQQQVQRQIGIGHGGRPQGDVAQFLHPYGVPGDPVVEDLPEPFHPRPAQVGQIAPRGGLDQLVDDVAAAQPEGVLGRHQLPVSAQRRPAREPCRALPIGDRRHHRAAPQGLGGIGLQVVGDPLVGAHDRLPTVPGPPVPIGQDVRERAVGRLLPGQALGLQDAGAHQRMPERHPPVPYVHQSHRLCRAEHLRGDRLAAQDPGRGGDLGQVVDGVDGRRKQRVPGLGRQLGATSGERAFKPVGETQRP